MNVLYLAVRDWRSANVQVWLQQLNPILYSLYATDLANHDITGNIMG